MCLDELSGLNKIRTGASTIKIFGKVINDEVSAPKKDRTDWWHGTLHSPGKLTVQLHWDNGKARLQLSVYDVMGVKIQDGRPWGAGGLKTVVAIERKGRYYIRVRAAGEDDESHYALRAIFKPESDAPAAECHDCTPGDKKCLGAEGYIICEQIGPKCNSWTKTFSCPKGLLCKNGDCGKTCHHCRKGSQRCSGSKAFLVCKPKKDGCRGWIKGGACPGSKVCSGGRCITPSAKPRPAPRPGRCVSGKIISMYKYRGRQTLHIEIGNNPAVQPGNSGYVLEGTSNKRLSGGDIKVTKVSGRYCIATTSLQKLGINRRVCIMAK